MAIVEISIIPLGTAHPSVGDYVARSLKVLKESGLKYELTPMSTVIEGDLNEIFHILRKMHEASFNNKVKRVVTLIKIDDRRDKTTTMEEKVKSILEKI